MPAEETERHEGERKRTHEYRRVVPRPELVVQPEPVVDRSGRAARRRTVLNGSSATNHDSGARRAPAHVLNWTGPARPSQETR
ncbi:hypothetical protein GCM10018980_49670 [Streptomyces capoamus]|uniref:Uncharacterized protein n=1 Tax=Streptomyces capoamus TaxID=68183 RepID=A0A919EZ68_9ACTN|nr:hypothetical protein GCM10010501_07020 [Streptomyces libani subsp. rufus]GHG60869.1 hypothetical protein GCM10018980_49670 [Streptomyces capoamus]